MTKVCLLCQQEKIESAFYKFYDRWTGNHYLSARCKPCHQQYKKSNPQTKRNRKSEKLRLRYGITFEQWESMREAENYSCMICGITEEEIGRSLDVDHCHNSGKVRGLLCNPCNTVLGHARDRIDLLEAAANYLKTNKDGYKP